MLQVWCRKPLTKSRPRPPAKRFFCLAALQQRRASAAASQPRRVGTRIPDIILRNHAQIRLEPSTERHACVYVSTYTYVHVMYSLAPARCKGLRNAFLVKNFWTEIPVMTRHLAHSLDPSKIAPTTSNPAEGRDGMSTLATWDTRCRGRSRPWPYVWTTRGPEFPNGPMLPCCMLIHRTAHMLADPCFFPPAPFHQGEGGGEEGGPQKIRLCVRAHFLDPSRIDPFPLQHSLILSCSTLACCPLLAG